MKRKNIIISSLIAIALCVSMIVGATFALFTSESKVNIAVSSGKVSVVANIDETSVETKKLYDTTYTQGASNMYEGVATFGEEGLTLEKFVPGDGIKFNIVVKNDSNVTVQYRTIISCNIDDGLFAGLDVTVGNNAGYNGVTLVSDWASLAVGSSDAIVPVSIELPEDAGDVYQEKTCTISYKVEAVQGNAQVENPEAGTIYLYSANDLKALSNYVANTDTVIELCADLDMQNQELKSIVAWYSDLTFVGNGHTISNVRFERNTEKNNGGAAGDSMFYTSTSSSLTVSDLKLVNASTEAGTDGRYSAIIDSYAQGAVTLTNVDVEDSAVVGTKSSGILFGHLESAATISDCDVKDSTVTLAACAAEPNGHYAGKVVGTIGGSAALTMNDCTITNVVVDGNLHAKNNGGIFGRLVNGGALTVDGAHYVATAAKLSALLSGSESEVNIILADGKYENVLTASNKTINIVGENRDGAEIALTNAVSLSHDHLGLPGCTVTLENVKVTFEDGAYYAAYINQPTMTYKNCTIIGQQYIYGNTSFIKCAFDNDDEAAKTAMRYTYIYDGDVLVDDCDFYTQGHGLIMYSDNGGAGDQTLTVRNSRFHGGQGRTAYAVANQNTAAIEIDGSCGANYTLILEGTNTFDQGFSGLWRIKGMKAGVNTTVAGSVYTGTTADVYLDGHHYTKDAGRNVVAD